MPDQTAVTLDMPSVQGKLDRHALVGEGGITCPTVQIHSLFSFDIRLRRPPEMPGNDNGKGSFGEYNAMKGRYKGNGDDGPVEDLEVFNAGEDDEDIPPREWLFGTLFCRSYMSGLIGDGGVGKTALRYLHYLSMAIGRSLTGDHVFCRARILIVCLEDDRNEVRRRIKAALLRYGISRAELDGWLFYAVPRGVKLAELKDGSPAAGKLEAMIRRAVARRKIDVVGFDPLIKAHEVEENSNRDMNFVSSLLAQLATELNISTDTCHHTKKGIAVAGDADAGRGASAVKDTGRLIYTLTRMTPKEAEEFSIGERERFLYVRHDSGKVNLAPPTLEAEWHKLVGINLGNGNEQYPNGDTVQTTECWEPPKSFEGMSTLVANEILDEIDRGLPDGSFYSSSNKAEEHEARHVVQRHMPDKTDAEARRIIKTWLKNGALYKDKDGWKHPESRKIRERLRVNHTKRPGTKHDA